MRPPDLKQKVSLKGEQREKKGRAPFLAVRDICTAMRARGPADLLVDSVT